MAHEVAKIGIARYEYKLYRENDGLLTRGRRSQLCIASSSFPQVSPTPWGRCEMGREHQGPGFLGIVPPGEQSDVSSIFPAHGTIHPCSALEEEAEADYLADSLVANRALREEEARLGTSRIGG